MLLDGIDEGGAYGDARTPNQPRRNHTPCPRINPFRTEYGTEYKIVKTKKQGNRQLKV